MNFLASVFRIVIVDLVLSGDNAVVIGMAAHRLEPRRRKAAILIGGGSAIVLRIILTAIAAFLLQIPGLRLAGGTLLFWIAFKLLAEEEEAHAGVSAAASMKEAITTILVADFIMSTDNVLGVAGASDGNVKLLVFGLVLSMAILMFMGSMVANLINRFWWLAYVGSAVIAWTGATMVVEDPFVLRYADWLDDTVVYAAAACATGVTLSLAHWFQRRRR